MSMENSAELQIQIFRKNNSVIRWKVSVGGKNMEPLGMAANFETETIFSGESLLLNMYSSYYPYSETKHWLQETGRYFHVIDSNYKFPSKEIAELVDFSAVREIRIKEMFDFDGEGTQVETFTINSDNCPYITNDRHYAAEELAAKKVNLPKSLTSIGEYAFYGCEKFVMNVEAGTCAHKYAEKYGLAHNVVSGDHVDQSDSHLTTDETLMSTQDKRIVGPAIDDATYIHCPFRALRLVTSDSIYVLYLEYDSEEGCVGEWEAFFDPDDYMPEIKDGTIMSGDEKIATVPALLAGLYFVLSDKIDYTILKTAFELMADTIPVQQAVEICLNCHTTNYLNGFPKGTFNKLGNMNPKDYANEAAFKNDVLQFIFSCFDERIPDFKRTVKVFKQVLTEVKNLNEIQFVDAVEGVTWEHELTDEEMWETTHKLDFSLLSFSEEVCVANTAQPTCTQRTTDVIDEEHKRLEEDELKRKEAEEQKRREEEERKQKEAEARRIAEEKAKAEAEARRIAEEKYQADLKVWEQTCENIKKQREQAVADRLSAAKATFEQAAQKDYDTAVSVATDRKKTAQQNKADAELRLSKLGLFKFAEKNAMKEAIAQAEAEIAAAEKELEQAKHDLNTTLAAISAKVSAQEALIRQSVEREIAYPEKPENSRKTIFM